MDQLLAAGLLRAILDSPGDDAPRLVYSDWLEERGEVERAEFIRVQVRLARLGNPYSEAEDSLDDVLRRRERDLFSRLCVRFDKELPEPLVSCIPGWDLGDGVYKAEFRRGFVEAVTCRLTDWVGGECGRCGGSGTCRTCTGKGRRDALVDAGYGNPLMRTHGWEHCYNCNRGGYGEHPGKCPHCDGTGRLAGHGPALVAAQPVTEVRVSDREPTPVGNPPRWFWFRGSRESHGLPPEVWDHLGVGNAPRCSADTEAAARSALGAALLAWAKAKTGGCDQDG